jgi:hypothetical protein
VTPRDTTTGRVLENMILPALIRGGYTYQVQVDVGRRLNGGRHRVDVLAEKNGERFLVSLKWQQVGGTAEQKVPFEVISLIDAVQTGGFTRAYVVLGGEGWTLRNFYINGGLNRYLVDVNDVDVVTLERFVAVANSGGL